jgi:hypothetical protein
VLLLHHTFELERDAWSLVFLFFSQQQQQQQQLLLLRSTAVDLMHHAGSWSLVFLFFKKKNDLKNERHTNFFILKVTGV